MKIVCSLFLLLLSAALCAAQSQKPDLSGKWVREKMKGSEFEVTLTIVHQDPELNVVRISKNGTDEIRKTFTYYTDARGETNLQMDAGTLRERGVKTKTKWSGRKIESHASFVLATMGRNFGNEDFAEDWELSQDGKKLTHRTSITTNPYHPNAFTTIETFRKTG